MTKKILILCTVMFFVAIANGQKKDTTIVTRVTINEIKQEKAENEPPPPGIDLSRFNIFALNDGRIFYYYDTAFVAKRPFDQLRIEKMNKSLIRKTDYTQLRTTIQSLLASKRLAIDGIIAGQDGNNEEIFEKLHNRVFAPLKIDEYSIGHVSKDLYRILDSVH